MRSHVCVGRSVANVRTLDHHPSPIVVGNFVVRQYEIEDAASLALSVTESLEHLLPWMPWAKFEPQSVQQRRDLIEVWNQEWQAGSNFVMGIFENNLVVGGTGFHLRGENGTIEIGYWVHAHHIGRGIAATVASALTSYAFEFLPEITTVQILHDEANEYSRRVPETLGFTMVETFDREPEAPAEKGVVLRWHKARE